MNNINSSNLHVEGDSSVLENKTEKEFTGKVPESVMGEIFDIIEKKTGMKAAILMLTSDTVPCAEKLSGKECHGHTTAVYKHNIRDGYVLQTLKQLVSFVELKGLS